MHVVCPWIGNSQAVAAKHYLQVTDEHFRQAAEGPSGAAQQPAESAGSGSQTKRKTPVFRGFASLCKAMYTV